MNDTLFGIKPNTFSPFSLHFIWYQLGIKLTFFFFPPGSCFRKGPHLTQTLLPSPLKTTTLTDPLTHIILYLSPSSLKDPTTLDGNHCFCHF